MSSHSEYVYIKADFEVFMSEPNEKGPLKIYDIIQAAPKFTTDEHPPVISVKPLWQKPHVVQFGGKEYAYYRAKIEINGELHGTSFKQACEEFELLTNFLIINYAQLIDGSATISSTLFDGTGVPDDCKEEFQTYDFGLDYRNGKETENTESLSTLLGSMR